MSDRATGATGATGRTEAGVEDTAIRPGTRVNEATQSAPPPPPPGAPRSGSEAGQGDTVERPAESEVESTRIKGIPPVRDEDQPTGADTRTTQRPVAAALTQDNPSSARIPRRARLRLTRVDPWSVMKTAFLLSIAFAVVTVVSVAMVWQVLGAAGVWDSINSTIQESIGGTDVASFQVEDYLGTSRVLGFTMLVAAIDVVLITAAATLTAFLYNMAAALLGGIEVTLAEDSH